MRKLTFLMISAFAIILMTFMSCHSDDSTRDTDGLEGIEMIEISDRALGEYLLYRAVDGVTWEIIDGEERYFLIPEKTKEIRELSLAKTSGGINSLIEAGVKTAEVKIVDVSALKYFTGLQSLTLTSNDIETLDLTALKELQVLQINNNLISNLDVSQNVNLIKLRYGASSKASENQKLSEINLTANYELEHLHLPGHNLVEVDLSNNENLAERLDLSGNPGPNGYGNIVVPDIIFNQIPANERLGVISDVIDEVESIEIPDKAFGEYLVKYVEAPGVTVEGEGENIKYYLNPLIVVTIESLSLSKTSGRIADLKAKNLETAEITIKDMTGIEYFTGLKDLTLSSNEIEKLDLTQLELLEVLQINGNLIKDLDVTNNKNLIKLRYSANANATDDQKLSSIDLTKNLELEHLHLPNHNLVEIDLSNNDKLIERLDLRGNPGPNGTGDLVIPKKIFEQLQDKFNVVPDE